MVGVCDRKSDNPIVHARTLLERTRVNWSVTRIEHIYLDFTWRDHWSLLSSLLIWLTCLMGMRWANARRGSSWLTVLALAVVLRHPLPFPFPRPCPSPFRNFFDFEFLQGNCDVSLFEMLPRSSTLSFSRAGLSFSKSLVSLISTSTLT